MKNIKLPDGTKRTIAAVIGLVNTFLTNKGVYDLDASNLITGLAALLLGWGIAHAVQKKKSVD